MQREPKMASMAERRRLTQEWSIELDPSFVGRVVDGDLQLVSPGPPVRTIWIAVWSPPLSQPVDETLAEIAADAHPNPTQSFTEAGVEDDERRYGSWYPETVDGRTQWGFYGYTVRPGSYVQAAFITDEGTDLPWALQTWRSLRWNPAS
jgi:hypothetical protein